MCQTNFQGHFFLSLFLSWHKTLLILFNINLKKCNLIFLLLCVSLTIALLMSFLPCQSELQHFLPSSSPTPVIVSFMSSFYPKLPLLVLLKLFFVLWLI